MQYKKTNDNTWNHIKMLSKFSFNSEGLVEYLKENKDDMHYDVIVDALMSIVQVTEAFIDENKELCEIVLELINTCEGEELGFTGALRMELFKSLAEKKSINIK